MSRGQPGGRRAVLATWLIAAPVLAILLWAVVLPNVSVIAGSFEGGFGHWRAFFANPSDRDALRNTIVVAVASVIAATAIGLPLAFLLTRAEFRGRRTLAAVATLPAALPPLVGVLAFYFLYGESGVLTRAVQHLFGLSSPPWTFTGVPAIIFVHACTMYVYVFLLVAAGLERYDSSLDEAAAGLGAGAFHRLRRVTLPMLTPAIAGAMLLVFMSALGSFSAPFIFGGGVRVLSTQILASRTNNQFGVSFVETTVLAVSALAALALFRWVERRRGYVLSGKGQRARRYEPRSAVVRALAPFLVGILVIALVLPHAMLALVSFAREGSWTTQVLPPAYGLDNFRRLATDPHLWEPIRNSVTMALVATLANVIFCVAAAYLVVMRRFRGRRVLEVLLSLPWAIPATAIAIGLASTFNRNDPLLLRVVLVGTWWILPLAYFIRGVPLVTTAVEGSLRQMDPSTEEAARGLGSPWWLTVKRVVLPAAKPGIVAGAVLAAITAVGEFVASTVLYSHSNRPISVEIYAQFRTGTFGTAAAYSLLLILLVFIITLLARWGENRVDAESSTLAG